MSEADRSPVGRLVDETRSVEQHTVVAAVLIDAGRVLLCHRSPGRAWYPNVWDVPGGHVIADESREAALRRELIEELGIDVGLMRERPAFELSDPVNGFDLTVWVVRGWRGTVRNLQPEEHDRVRWFTADDLPGLPFADDRYLDILERLLAVG